MKIEKEQNRPINPYRKNSIMWSLMEGSIQEEYDGLPGWSDLTKRKIGEVLGISTNTVVAYICEIKRRTGYVVRFCDGRTARDDEEG